MSTRHLSIDDLPKIRTLSDPRIRPDGSQAVAIVKTMNVDANRYDTNLWMLDIEDARFRQWTRGNKDSHPRWSPDGSRIAFLRTGEDKKTQIVVMASDGGEAQPITDLPIGALDGFHWSPDGTKILFAFRPSDSERTDDARDERKRKKLSEPPRHITKLRYRAEGSGWVPNGYRNLWVVDTNSDNNSAKQITDGERDMGDFCWSPDGAYIAYTQNVGDDPDYEYNRSALFVRSVDGENVEPRRLSAPLGAKYHLTWSPDGESIAYLGHDQPDETWGVRNIHPWSVPAMAHSTQPARDLAADMDVTFGCDAIGDVSGGGNDTPIWAADSSGFYTLASERGSVSLYFVHQDGIREAEQIQKTAILAYDVTPHDQVIVLMSTDTDNGDLYLLQGENEARRLTTANESLFVEAVPIAPIPFDAPSPEGHNVPCWALLPPDFAENPRPHPTILYIHGGPHTQYTHTIFHEYQMLAAQGYVVLFPNPRGSKGYGEAWTAAIAGDWGTKAMSDCLACVDYAVAQGWANTEKLGVAGGSYGGFLTGWIVGHTDRFRAAIAERGVFNLHSMAGTCDFIWRDDRTYFRATASSDPGEYLRNSPLTYADNVTTPTLIIHSEGDLRCPIEQAEQFYAALRRNGKSVEFLRYGTEVNHELSRSGVPDLRLDRLHRILDWFDTKLKGDTTKP